MNRPIVNLVIEVPATLRLQVGRLGEYEFPAGTYVYTGSARQRFEARLARHARADKRIRWHIDYLLAAPGRLVVTGFGASDRRVGCGSHLRFRRAR